MRSSRDYNAPHRRDVLLTSHYMADVEALCQRVIVIHHGRLLFDGELADLAAVRRPQDGDGRVHGRRPRPLIGSWPRSSPRAPGTEVAATTDASVTMRVASVRTCRRVAAMALAELDVVDLAVEDPPIDDVIEQVFDVPIGEAIG